jgi:dipeptidyl aminopeptidase/acylaminoacyl peptidase
MSKKILRHSPSYRVRTSRVVLLICTLYLAYPNFINSQAQQPGPKRALTHQDYDDWRAIQGEQISRNGKFIAYALIPQDGDGELIVRNLATGTEYRHGRGWRPPTPRPDFDDPAAAQAFIGRMNRLTRPTFTADSRFVIFSIEPNKADLLKARKEKKKPEEMPKNALGIMDLSSGQVSRVEKVKNFQVPEDGAGFIAYLLEPLPEGTADQKRTDGAGAKAGARSGVRATTTATSTVTAGARAASETPAGVVTRRPRERKKEYGSDLVVLNLSNSNERTIADVLEYSFSKDAKNVVYTVSAKIEEGNGIYAVTPGSDAAPVELLAGRGKYDRITWDEDQTQLAFISDRDDASADQPKFKLYHWDRRSPNAVEIVSSASPNFRPGMVISDKASLSFSLDGSHLFFGVAPPPEREKDRDGEESSDEKVIVDLWHWKDDYIQPMQKVRAERERNRSYRAVYHLKEKKFIQLADETLQDVNTAANGLWAIGLDDRGYRTTIGWESFGGIADIYLVNTLDGSRKELLKKNRSNVTLSPNGKYGLFFDGKDWNTFSTANGKITNITKNLAVGFWREDNDVPNTPPPYGNAGWAKDDKYVLLYDRYDIWQVAPDGSSAKNLTDGVGRRESIEFRYVRLDSDEKWIDPFNPILLRAENQSTLDSGFYRDSIDGGMPERLFMAAKSFAQPAKAKDADTLMLTATRFDEFPDIYVTDLNFKELRKSSNAGAQREKFLWGKAELIRYKNTDGVSLSGILVKPENFNPKQKYPMIVYIYEKLSDNLHRFVNPSPGTSINASFYASNGYLVLMPDIVYTIGYPGQSALKCVLPAIQSIVDQGYVKEDAIGIQGHSWGGYQIAYMVTQTNRFRAAAPGALVGNMTSAYSGIRWGTGLPRQFQYEHTQSRIGGNLWEFPIRFIENSPVFHAHRVETPILSLHNDNDDAVPWYQGIEYYLALRRLGKEVYLFNYNGEYHGLRKRQNQKDYTRRMQEFFDHYLKGAPRPQWMESGIPYLEREKEKDKYKISSDNKEKAQN